MDQLKNIFPKDINVVTKNIISCTECENFDELESRKRHNVRYSFCTLSRKIIKDNVLDGDVQVTHLTIPDDCPLLKPLS